MLPVKRPLPKPRLPIKLPPRQKRMTKGRWIGLAVVILLLGVGVAWAAGYIGPDSRLAEIKELQKKMGDPSLKDEDRRALWGEMQKKMEALPPDLQRKAFQGGPPGGNAQADHMKDVLALPPDKLVVELDKDIDRMTAMTKFFEQSSKGGPPKGPPGASGAPPGGPPGGAPPSGAKDGPGEKGGPPGGPPGGFPGRGGSDAQWTQFHNSMLASIPADRRATFHIYMQLLQVRANQRGVSMSQFGPH